MDYLGICSNDERFSYSGCLHFRIDVNYLVFEDPHVISSGRTNWCESQVPSLMPGH